LAEGAGNAAVGGGVVEHVVGAHIAEKAIEVGIGGRTVLALPGHYVIYLHRSTVAALQIPIIPILRMLTEGA
jgi:hypothetical protein